ncbi:MAG: trypsin-like serine peptidase [Pyrinomonadaceae bacterium]
MGTEIKDRDKDTLVETLTERAIDVGDLREYFRSVGLEANLPKAWYSEYLAKITPNPRNSSQFIVRWALGQEVNTKDPRFTTLGSLLYPMLKDFGLETAQQTVAIIVSNRLIRDQQLVTKLMSAYGVPFPAEGTCGDLDNLSIPLTAPAENTNVGPEMNWRGPEDVTLQGFFWDEPDYTDGRFLMRATDRALSVCRVSIPGKRRGTGFLFEKNTLLLTNYHVLEDPETPGDDKNANAANAVLEFKYFSKAEGEEEKSQEFKLAPNPIVDFSIVPELDFVLLRVEDAVANAPDIKPLKYKEVGPSADKSLNIIQHPDGGPLKFAFSGNGVTGRYDDGRIQYTSRASGGSSGSPCFNDNWELIALHHAERSTIRGVRREGLQFDHIFRKIKDKLAN